MTTPENGRDWITKVSGFSGSILLLAGQIIFLMFWGVRTEFRLTALEVRNQEQDRVIERLDVDGGRRVSIIIDRQARNEAALVEREKDIMAIRAAIQQFRAEVMRSLPPAR